MPWWITDGILEKSDKAPSETSILMNMTGNGTVVLSEGVTSIGDRAFYECTNLTSIVIPEGVTSIGEWAFFQCDHLTSIVFPSSVTFIGNGAFWCKNLNSIVLNILDDTTDVSKLIEGLGQCDERITDVNISENHPVFRWENGLLISKTGVLLWAHPDMKDVIIPQNVTSIGSYAFYQCKSLASISIPEGVTSIGECAFCWCENLTHMEMPDSVTSIGRKAFCGCEHLTKVKISKGITSITEELFFLCENLTSVELSDGVMSIGKNAFTSCRRLTHIEIPESVTTIGEEAFYRCSDLTSITIPNSVMDIGEDAFHKCRSLTSMILSTQHLEMIDGFTVLLLNSISCPISLKEVSKEVRPKLCIGFAQNLHRYSEELCAEYMDYICKNAEKLVGVALDYLEMLWLMCRKKLISSQSIMHYIDESIKRENIEATAMLLQYQSTALDAETVDALQNDWENWDE